jgi:hypothetical protein
MRNINSQIPLKNHNYNKYSKKAKTESNISNAVNIPSQLRNAITQVQTRTRKEKLTQNAALGLEKCQYRPSEIEHKAVLFRLPRVSSPSPWGREVGIGTWSIPNGRTLSICINISILA